MGKRIGGIGLAVIFAFAPVSVLARGPRNAPTVGVDGVMYNTNSPEWRQAGGNLEVYQQIIAQKFMMQQQQMMMKQQQAYMQMQKKMAAQSKASGTNASSANSAAAAARFQAGTRKKKKPRTYDPTRPVTSGAQKPATETTATATTPSP